MKINKKTLKTYVSNFTHCGCRSNNNATKYNNKQLNSNKF